MAIRKIIAFALTLMTCASSKAQEVPWVELFNGQSLSGWTATGEADAWAAREGEIVVVNPGAGGWLRTTKTYRDFELVLDFWLPEGGNSGVGLRGSAGGDPAFTGFEVQILDSKGDDPDIRNCGAVYEAIAPAEMAVDAPGTWNTYRIHLVGDRLDVWLNDMHIHNAAKLDERGIFRNPEQPLPLNTRATTGYISLQDHGSAFRFRNIRIRDLSPDPEPDGMIHLITPSLGGWFAQDDGEWTVENGALVGRDGPGHIFTKQTFTDFELRALVHTNTRGNSGLYFRTTPNPDPDNPWPHGYESQVDHHDPKNFTGCIYDRAYPDRETPITRDGAWFDYRIRVEGDRIRTWVNGERMVDATLDDFVEGHIALQTHHSGNVIMYKDLRVVELAEGP